ncbi:MAG: site-specific integrase [Magnetospirillum sp.]|nr:site-specific integrase [Magnetospirillum sp.]
MKQAKVLNEGEFARVLAAIGTTRHAARNRTAIMLSHYAGLRVGEIAALVVGDVLDSRNEVRESLTLRAAITKSGETRIVFLGERLRNELKAYLSKDKPRPTDAPLLPSQRGAAFSANSLCQLFGRLYALAGIDGASSHSGRRWFITQLAHSGVSLKVIMALAGHKNLATTQRYIEVSDAMMRDAVQRL